MPATNKSENSIVQSRKQDGTKTISFYPGLDKAHAFFNKEMFAGKLPPAAITPQRHNRSFGYFSGGRLEHAHAGKGKAWDEIAINPMHVAERSIQRVVSTLVHEMVHQWQHHFGKRPTRCYHDKQWAAKMKEVGLYPSSTGERGGKEIGPQVSHYIVAGGLFDITCEKFLRKYKVMLFQDVALAQTAVRKAGKSKADDDDEEGGDETPVKSTGRVKFQCKGCKLNAWAKATAKLRCDDCDRPLRLVETNKEDDDNG